MQVGPSTPYKPSLSDSVANQVTKNTHQKNVKKTTYTILTSKCSLVSLIFLSTVFSFRVGMVMGGVQVNGDLKRVGREVSEDVVYYALVCGTYLAATLVFQVGLLYFAIWPQNRQD